MFENEINNGNPISEEEMTILEQNASIDASPSETATTVEESAQSIPETVEPDFDESEQNEAESAEMLLEAETIPHKEQPLLDQLTALTEKVGGLSKLFEAKILHTDHEEKIVDKMHSELQKYKEDLYSQLVRPILLDIIEIRDSIRRMVEVRKNKPEDEQYIPLKDFLLYVDEIDIILDKNNIEIFGSTEGSEFIPVRQRIIQKVITHDQALHGKVAASLSDGYNYTGKTISSEKVAVYLYKAPAAEPAENKEEINNG